MKADVRESQSQSLGELVSGLRPGEPCPWCGGVLRADGCARCVEETAPTEAVERVREPVLRCADCGSEVHWSHAEGRSGESDALGAAA